MKTKKLSFNEMEEIEGGKTGCLVGGGWAMLSTAVALGFLIAAPGGIAVAALLATQAQAVGSVITGCLL